MHIRCGGSDHTNGAESVENRLLFGHIYQKFHSNAMCGLFLGIWLNSALYEKTFKI